MLKMWSIVCLEKKLGGFRRGCFGGGEREEGNGEKVEGMAYWVFEGKR